MSAKILAFARTSEPQVNVTMPEPKEKRESKPKSFKHLTGNMHYALGNAVDMFSMNAELYEQRKHLEQIQSVLSSKGDWLVFHKSLIKDFQWDDTETTRTVTLTFTGKKADEILRMLRGKSE